MKDLEDEMLKKQYEDSIRRTEMFCHFCNTTFVAELDFDINGNHEIFCPHCDHIHCRTIKDGKITGIRWANRNDNVIQVRGRSVWRSSVIKAQTSTVAMFIRDQWLNRSDIDEFRH